MSDSESQQQLYSYEALIERGIKEAGGEILFSDLSEYIRGNREATSAYAAAAAINQNVIRGRFSKHGTGITAVISLKKADDASGEIIPVPSDLSQQSEMFLAKVTTLPKVNSDSSVALTLAVAPIKVANCGIMQLSSPNKRPSMTPIGGGLSLYIQQEVSDAVIVAHSRRIDGPVVVTLLPVGNKSLDVNGRRWDSKDAFSLEVPAGKYLIVVPDSSLTSLSINGEEIILRACMAYTSGDDQFDGADMGIYPLIWDCRWTVEGSDGVEIKDPYVGFVVPRRHVPEQFKHQFDKAILNRPDGLYYAAILALPLNGRSIWYTTN